MSRAEPVGTGFTYQGWLADGHQPAEGWYDFQFNLFDAPTDGRQIAGTIEVNDVNVVDGHFAVELDFCQAQGQQGRVLLDIFGGDARWLEIGVRPASGSGGLVAAGLDSEPYTVLGARQKIVAAPYALHALSGGGLYDVLRWPSNWDLGVEEAPKTPGDAGGQNLFNVGRLGVGPYLPEPAERLDLSWSGGVNARIGRYNYLGSCFSSATLVLGNNARVRTDSVNGIVVGQPHDSYGYRAIAMGSDGIVFHTLAGKVAPGDAVASERMRIANDGKVGIGTATPQTTFQVGSGLSTFSTFPLSNDKQIGPGTYTAYGTQGIGFNLYRKDDGTWETPAKSGGAALLGHFYGLNIACVNSAPPSTPTTFTDAQIAESVWMTILADGRVGLGRWPSARLDVNGDVRIRTMRSVTSGMLVCIDGNGELQRMGSSRRFKTNVRDLQDDLEKVLDLRPVRFQCTTTGQEDIGLIAEEVAESMKDLVIYDADGKPEAVKYDRISLYLLRVVKNLRSDNESLKSENESLRQRLDLLERRMERLERDGSRIIPGAQ